MQEERKDDMPQLISRNDVPKHPGEYQSNTDFGKGILKWIVEPYPKDKISSWELKCEFGDLPELSEKAKALGFEGEVNGFTILKAIIPQYVIDK